MLTLQAGKQTVTELAFSADGRWLAAGGTGKKVHVWDLTAAARGPLTFSLSSGSPEWAGFLPDGRVLALESYGRYVTFDPAIGTKAVGNLGQGRWVGRVATTPDRSAFYGTGNEAQRWDFDGTSLSEVWNFVVPDTKSDVVTGRGGVVIPPDGTVVAAVSNGRNKTWLHVRDDATGKLLSKRQVANTTIRDLTLLPDGRTLLFVREDGSEDADEPGGAAVAASTGKKFRDVFAPPAGVHLTALAAHPTAPRAAVGHSDGVVRVLDTETWAEVTAYQWDKRPVTCVAFAPDGLTAAVAFDGTGPFVVWDLDL